MTSDSFNVARQNAFNESAMGQHRANQLMRMAYQWHEPGALSYEEDAHGLTYARIERKSLGSPGGHDDDNP